MVNEKMQVLTSENFPSNFHRNCTLPFWNFSSVSPNLTGLAQKLLLHFPVVPGMHGAVSIPLSFSVTVIELSMLYSLLPMSTLPFSVLLKTSGWPNWATPSHAGWNIQCVTTSCVCQTGGMTVVPGKSSSRARICLEMWGICLNTAFHQTLDFFLRPWGAALAALLYLCSVLVCLFVCFLFHISATQRETFWSSLVWILPRLSWVCSHETQGLRLITEPLSFCSDFPVLHQGSNLEDLPHLSCLSASTSQPLVQGSKCRTQQVQLPSPQTVDLIPSSREISAILPIDVSGAKISPCRKDRVLSIYRVNVAI